MIADPAPPYSPTDAARAGPGTASIDVVIPTHMKVTLAMPVADALTYLEPIGGLYAVKRTPSGRGDARVRPASDPVASACSASRSRGSA